MAARSKKRVAKKSGVGARKKKKSAKKVSAPRQRSAKTSARKEPARSAVVSPPEKADVVYSDIRGSMRAAIRRRFL